MSLQNAITVCAASQALAKDTINAWEVNADELKELGANTDRRIASLIGQCSHESGGFKHRSENLNYSADGLQRVFRKYFPTPELAADYARQPEKIANRVYADRMGNGNEASGDGWRYRGRGYIQLTGKDNYRTFGTSLRIDLLANPEAAAVPATSWLLAVRYYASRRRSGKTLLEWADADDERMITLGINGGTNGLEEREILVAKALSALSGKTPVIEWQSLLAHAGFDPGTIDGLWGKNTKSAMDAAEAEYGLSGEPLAEKLRGIA